MPDTRREKPRVACRNEPTPLWLEQYAQFDSKSEKLPSHNFWYDDSHQRCILLVKTEGPRTSKNATLKCLTAMQVGPFECKVRISVWVWSYVWCVNCLILSPHMNLTHFSQNLMPPIFVLENTSCAERTEFELSCDICKDNETNAIQCTLLPEIFHQSPWWLGPSSHRTRNPLMLLVSCVNSPIHSSVFHCLHGACCKVLCVLCELGLGVTCHCT